MNKNDRKIKALRQLVEERRLELGERPIGNLLTDGIIPIDNSRLNILDACRESLVAAYATIKADYEKYLEAANELGFENYDFKFLGYPFEYWKSDLKFASSLSRYNTRKKELGEIELRLKNLLSDDAKTAEALEEIEKSLA